LLSPKLGFCDVPIRIRQKHPEQISDSNHGIYLQKKWQGPQKLERAVPFDIPEFLSKW